MNMKRVKLIVAYDGTNYCGWQVQINGITVEEVLNKTLSELCHEDIKVIGASRTDSGVHALGNVAVFDTESGIPGEKFSFALNQRLPEDIRIQESCQVADDFHPRYCDTIKTYEYKILNRRFDMPTERLYSTFVYYPLDIDKMKRAAASAGWRARFQELLFIKVSGGEYSPYNNRYNHRQGGRHDTYKDQWQWFPVQYGPHHSGNFDEDRSWNLARGLYGVNT